MARLAEADSLLHGLAIELPLVPLVVVSGARDEVVLGQPFFATAQCALTDHSCLFIPSNRRRSIVGRIRLSAEPVFGNIAPRGTDT